MSLCREHHDLVRRVERAAAAVERAHEDISEVRRDLRALSRSLSDNVASLLKANGARREQLGELRGRIMAWSAAMALAVSAAVSLLAARALGR